jgi:hypothetical protein
MLGRGDRVHGRTKLVLKHIDSSIRLFPVADEQKWGTMEFEFGRHI